MSIGLVRYGRIPEVARFLCGGVAGLNRGAAVVVETHRGLELGEFLGNVAPGQEAERALQGGDTVPPEPILRVASPQDQIDAESLQQQARDEFGTWIKRIAAWGLELELIDLEWTLDRGKLILYVLNDRGPECTKLALQAAAAGLGPIEVQPVTAEGLVTLPQGGGGCGSCGCG